MKGWSLAQMGRPLGEVSSWTSIKPGKQQMGIGLDRLHGSDIKLAKRYNMSRFRTAIRTADGLKEALMVGSPVRKQLWIGCLGLCLLMTSTRAETVEIKASFALVEQLLRETTFTQEGRYYLDGSPDSRCRYAYLEWPEVRPAGDRVELHVHFSGRSAVELLGNCVGPGDAFDVVFSGKPYAREGVLGLEDLRIVEAGDPDNPFHQNLKIFCQNQLPAALRLEVLPELERLIGQANQQSPYHLAISAVRLQNAAVQGNGLVLRFDVAFSIDVEGGGRP